MQISPASMSVQHDDDVNRIYAVVVDLVGLTAFSTFIHGNTSRMTQMR